MTKYEAYRFLQDAGVGFVANVILTSHSSPASKLKGAARLVQQGHTVTLGATIDQLVIDGERTPWSCLEDAASARHVTHAQVPPSEAAGETPAPRHQEHTMKIQYEYMGVTLNALDAAIKEQARATAAQITKEEMELTLRGKQAPQQLQAEPVGLFAQHQEELF